METLSGPRRTILSGGPFEAVFGYARAVRVGDQIHVSGTTARGEALAQPAYEQCVNILSIIRDALAESGARMEDVVRTVIYVTDLGDTDAVARAHREAFAQIRPAATLVQVAGLLRPQMRVEIEAYAVLGG